VTPARGPAHLSAPGAARALPGAAPGYRPSATLTFGAELRRQAGRARTRLTLAFMLALPLVVLAAFELGRARGGGGGGGRGQFARMAELATSGGLNFALFTLLVSSSFLLVVAVALLCGDTVASEAGWGSLRYLLAVPVPRARLLGTKLLVALASSLVALVVLTGTALLAGTLRYGWHPLATTVAGEIAPGPALLRLLGIVAYVAVSLLVVASLAFLLSVATDAPLGAVGGAVLLQIVSSILDQITILGSLRVVLPTHYSEAWLGLLSNPVQTGDMLKGAISTLAYASVLLAWAWYHFLRKDVVS
jgi:ABC-2 type transport system permease protein